MSARLLLFAPLVLLAGNAFADEAAALRISRNIQESHTPFGLLVDVMYTAPESRERMGYLGFGDAALWTSLYLASDAYRFAATGSPEALAAAKRTLDAIDKLSRISGDGLLARYFYPAEDPYAAFFLRDRAGADLRTANLDGRDYYFATRTSRDQYAGVFFGLGAAYDLIDDDDVRTLCRTITTRLVDYLISHRWHIYEADGKRHDTFFHRPEQRLSILQLAAHINPPRFRDAYRRHRRIHSRFAWFGVLIDVFDRGAYYKYNLDHLYFFNLLRLEPRGTVAHAQYERAYQRMRDEVRSHLNAHFNMIDRALAGPDGRRDAETVELLEQLRSRGTREKTMDARGVYKACGDNRSCDPLPVRARVYSDFLWQREPFRLSQEGDARIERSGLDYILPYWMARYYGVIATPQQ